MSKKQEGLIKLWTLDTAASGTNQLAQLADTLETLTLRLKPALEKLAEVKSQKRKAATTAANEAAKARARVVAPYKGNAPDVLLRFLYDQKALGQQNFINRIDAVTPDESVFDPSRPAHFAKSADSKGAGSRVQSLPEKITEARLRQAEKTCEVGVEMANGAQKRIEP